jgi:hypothetical protein
MTKVAFRVNPNHAPDNMVKKALAALLQTTNFYACYFTLTVLLGPKPVTLANMRLVDVGETSATFLTSQGTQMLIDYKNITYIHF